MSNLSMDERRNLAWKLINGLTMNEDLKARLPRLAVDPAAAATEGERLSAALEQAIIDQTTLEGKLTTMWEQMHTRHDAAWAVFKKYRGRALDVTEGMHGLRQALELNEWLAEGRPSQLTQMLDVYTLLLSNAEVLALLPEVNVTREKLTAARNVVAGLQTFESSIMLVNASKLAATERQTAALDALDLWREDLYERIEFVTKDAPHIRKSIGMKG